MRILCLHGYGGNPEILQYQMSGILQQSDPAWEFVFMPGDVPCSAPPGLEAFPEPYFCYNGTFDWANEAIAHEILDEMIHSEGPFDGVVAFSQGAAVITSYIIEKKMNGPDQSIPFGFVVLCSATIPLSSDGTYVKQVYGGLSISEQSFIRSCEDDKISKISGPTRDVVQMVAGTVDAVQKITTRDRAFFLDRPMDRVPCMLHPSFCPIRLPLASLIVWGENEEPAVRACGQILQSFFDSAKQRTFQHTAGHDIPRSGAELKKLVSEMEWVVLRSQTY